MALVTAAVVAAFGLVFSYQSISDAGSSHAHAAESGPHSHGVHPSSTDDDGAMKTTSRDEMHEESPHDDAEHVAHEEEPEDNEHIDGEWEKRHSGGSFHGISHTKSARIVEGFFRFAIRQCRWQHGRWYDGREKLSLSESAFHGFPTRRYLK